MLATGRGGQCIIILVANTQLGVYSICLPWSAILTHQLQSAKRTAVGPRGEFDLAAETLMSEWMYLNGATIMRGMRW